MRHSFVIVLTLAASACGASSGVTTADVQKFNALSQNVSSAAASYGTTATGMTGTASCNDAENAYDARVRPMISEMQGMAPRMDDKMGSMSHMPHADMECGANAMMAELDRHKTVACASATDMAPNKTEAQQHVTAITQWADHEMARSAEIGSMMGMGMGGMGGSGMTTGHCVHNADGSYTMQP